MADTQTPAPTTPTPQTPAAGGGDSAPRMVAWDNFSAVVTAKEGLERQVQELKTTNQQLLEKAATVDNLTGQVNEWKGKAAAALEKFSVFTELSGALGTQDADVIDAFDSKYRALPEANRPDRKAWVDTMKAKPDEAPTVLRPWLATTAPAGGNPARPPQPKPPGTGTQPGGTAAPTADQIRAIREKAVNTGDWSEWKTVRKQLGAK